ncbi:MAG: hypothetical protein ABI867_32455 [Kofleriaceae bacterium]
MKPLLIAVAMALAAGPAVAEKPSAPVTLHLDAQPVAGGYQVTLVAVATRAVPALELRLAGKRIAFGATAAGERRELVAQVAVAPGDPLDVLGAARADGRGRVTSVHVGTAKQKAARPVTRTLPDGRTVREAR